MTDDTKAIVSAIHELTTLTVQLVDAQNETNALLKDLHARMETSTAVIVDALES
jgi:hypothetical protein